MIAFISDIHGNLSALKAVIGKIDQIGCNEVFCLGDIAGYYSQINECIDLIRERNIYSILGNHDYYLLTNKCCNSKTVKICIDYQQKVITQENRKWLSNLNCEFDTDLFSLRHAGWKDALEERFSTFDFSNVRDLPSLKYFSGHSHIQYLEHDSKSERIYCNPGSVGQPRDNDARAAFAILEENGNVELCRVEYDIDSTAYYMRKNGLGDWIWKCLYEGKQIGK